MTASRYDPNTQFPSPPLAPPSAQLSVSEAQRAQVIQHLSQAFADDRLSVEELDARLSRVYQATSVSDLERLLADPSDVGASLGKPSQYRRVAQEFAVPERGVGVAVMGGFERGAGWVVPRHFKAVAVMGGVALDLREARFAPGVTEIECFTVWGGVEILVPDGLRVEVVGMAVMGGFSAKTPAADLEDPNVPVLRVSGFALMAGVDIKQKTQGRKSERRYVEALERAEVLRVRR